MRDERVVVAKQAGTIEALAVAVAANVPVLLWGPPGSGKTSVVRSLAEAAGVPIEVVIAAIREPSDFGGLPVVGPEGVRLEPPAWAVRLRDAGRGVLFFDEVSTAPPAVQSALLRVVLDRWAGDLRLPDAVTVVAAANPPEQAAGGWDLAPPLANRFCHLDWSPDAAAFASGMVGGWPAPPTVRIDPARAEAALAANRSLVGAFITARPQLLCSVPDDTTAAGRAWPSPRSWDTVAQLCAAVDASRASKTARRRLVRGCVGDGAAVEFLTWVDRLDLPDPETVLADPDAFALPERGDKALAALAALASAVVANNTPGTVAASVGGAGPGGDGATRHRRGGRPRPRRQPTPGRGRTQGGQGIRPGAPRRRPDGGPVTGFSGGATGPRPDGHGRAAFFASLVGLFRIKDSKSGGGG